ncbi:hypothetical protein [Terrabacter sp. Root181]|uniref:hypothetical protein n=1 Tax=Terrabacter sp. Root181 TaxID=1736484 RepID=UPI0006F28F01|nr:hypothetical protein [Terrabacter sp. Root181]KRB44129.1 hypothetical protein ASD90_17020 [Terrabacter sp. Root181]
MPGWRSDTDAVSGTFTVSVGAPSTVSGAAPSAQNDLAAGFHRHRDWAGRHEHGEGDGHQLVDRVVVTQATYRTSTREWRVVGTATGPPLDLVTVRLGAADTLIGSAAVDTTGAWSVRIKGSPAGPDASGTVTATSTRGATVSAVPVQVTP